jgi:hypothetical protein
MRIGNEDKVHALLASGIVGPRATWRIESQDVGKTEYK